MRVELDRFFEASKNVQSGSTGSRVTGNLDEGGSEEETEDVSVPLKRSVHRLLNLLPPVDRTRPPALDKIAGMKDKHVLRLFERAVAPTDTITESIRARDDLMQRLESKSVLGQYAGYLFDIAGFLFANAGMLHALLRHLISLKKVESNSADGSQVSDKHGSHIGLVLLLAKHASFVFRGSCPQLQQLLAIATGSSANQPTLAYTLPTLLKHAAAVIAKDREASQLCNRLMAAIDQLSDQSACEHYTEALLRVELHCEFNDANEEKGSKLSRADWDRLSKQRRTAVSLHERAGTVFTSKHCVANMIKNLTEADKLSLDNPRLIHDLRVLSTLFRVPTVITASIDYKYPYSTMIAPVYELRRERILEFLHGSVLCPSFLRSADTLPVVTTKESDSSKRANRPSDGSASTHTPTVLEQYERVFDTVCGALQLWAALSGAEEEIKQWVETKYSMNFHLYDDDNTGELAGRRSSDTSSAALLNMVEVLFSCIYSNGTCVGDVYLHSALEAEARELNEQDEMDAPPLTKDLSLVQQRSTLHSLVARVADTATLCVVNLLHLKVVGARIPVEHWKRLGWRFIDAHPSFRKRLVDSYLNLIQTHAIHPRFLAYVCLLATDERYGKQAETVLVFSMKRLRATHENLNSRILMHSASVARGDDESVGGSEADKPEGRQKAPKQNANIARLKNLAQINMPETIMPYVLYLLSYHPEFPTSSTLEEESDKKKAQRIMQCLRLVVNTLLSSLSRDANNLAYLLKQTNTLVQYHVDRQDPGNIGIHFVSRMVIQILKDNIRTAESLQAYPGEINLPMDLFAHKKTSKIDLDNSYLRDLLAFDVAENNQETFEKVFTEKVMKKGGKQGGKKLLSPIASKFRPAAKAVSRRPAPQSRTSLEDSSSDDEKNGDDGEDDFDGGKKKRKFKVTGNIEEDDEEDIRLQALVTLYVNATSNRPARAARARVNYREADESEREVEKWEAVLARQELEKKKRLSAVSRSSDGSIGEKVPKIAGYFPPVSHSHSHTQSSAGGSSLSSPGPARLSGDKGNMMASKNDGKAHADIENVPVNKTSRVKK